MVWLRLTGRAALGPDVWAPPRDEGLRQHSQAGGGAAPLLIVNADDFGRNAESTDAILDCYSAGGITSASAMVWMEDSRRARDLAEEVGIPVGLHLNLTQPLTDPAVPTDIRNRQAALVRYFGSPARWVFNPILRRGVERSIDEQVDQYLTLYGRAPTHIDGHHHVHISPNVLVARALPRGIKIRPSFTFFEGEKWLLNRVVRHGLNAYIARRFRSPRYFFSIRTLHPDLGGTGMYRKLRFAERGAVEIMCHPAFDDERRVLKSDDWRAAIAALHTGSYNDLR